MRTTQFRGLPNEAIDFLDQMAIKKVKFPDNWEDKIDSYSWDHLSYINGYKQALHDYLPKTFISNPIGVVTGIFEEEVHTLLEYKLIDGNWVEEYIQAEPWSSGPVIFLALREKESKRVIVKWPQEDIDNA